MRGRGNAGGLVALVVGRSGDSRTCRYDGLPNFCGTRFATFRRVDHRLRVVAVSTGEDRRLDHLRDVRRKGRGPQWLRVRGEPIWLLMMTWTEPPVLWALEARQGRSTATRPAPANAASLPEGEGRAPSLRPVSFHWSLNLRAHLPSTTGSTISRGEEKVRRQHRWTSLPSYVRFGRTGARDGTFTFARPLHVVGLERAAL